MLSWIEKKKERNDPTIKQIDEQNNPVVKHWNGL